MTRLALGVTPRSSGDAEVGPTPMIDWTADRIPSRVTPRELKASEVIPADSLAIPSKICSVPMYSFCARHQAFLTTLKVRPRTYPWGLSRGLLGLLDERLEGGGRELAGEQIVADDPFGIDCIDRGPTLDSPLPGNRTVRAARPE